MINAIDAIVEERQRTVLIVDDFPEDRRVYQRYFLQDKEWRYKTLEAGTGEEAISLFRESRPDCVLLDYRLPDLNGMEVLAAIVGDSDEAICPVVMLTAEEDIAVAVEALKSGAQDYLNKNRLTAIDLLHSINRSVERVTLRRENAGQRRALLEQNRKLEEALAASSRAEEILRRDIAARKQAEEALRESEERYRIVTETASDAIITVDEEGVILLVNRAAEKIFGYQALDLLGQDLTILIPDYLREMRRSDFKRYTETGRRRISWDGIELMGLHRSGNEIPVEVTFGEYSKGGRHVFTGIIRDITERKRIELERDLLLRREQHARQLAEEANRAKDEFLAVVTHELRSPLNAMLGYARIQCAKQRIDPEEARRDFETIRRNGERQKALIDDLLDTARIITGKLRIEVGPVDLAGVVNDAIETVRPAADSKLIRLSSKLDPQILGNGQVKGDAVRLQQIVWNLLTNAIKFTPEGGQVEVKLERVRSRVSLTVRDTGSGIAPEFLPHIFDRFTQQDTSPSRRYSGLGLGLALVKQLVEMHGGEIRATSAGEGQGAAFSLTLPAMADGETRRQGDKETRRQGDFTTPSPPVPLSPCPPLPSSLPLPLSSVGVLIVDDEEDARTLVAKVLEESGANVVAVSSAVEAFAMITEPPRPDWPDVLVCDIGMPEEDGYSLMRRIRDWERERGIYLPSVALTALNRAEDRLNALGAGYKMHIAKPFEAEEVITVVKNLARGRQEIGRSLKNQ
jgi:PAS domain S-box-containing protein